jgi:hypothetical protein
MSRQAIWLTVFFCALSPASARAHFLFVRICPPAEGGRAAEVYFSELATAGDPRFIEKVAPARFFVQKTPGEFAPLEMRKLSDRLRAHLPAEGSLMVAGQLDYGVLARPGETPFLLRHFSKAVAGNPDEVNRLSLQGTTLEIGARFEKEHVLLTALLDGKPLAEATFFTVDTNLSGEELKADNQGRATFAPAAAGEFSIYIKHVDPTPGEHKGTGYKEIREFATLAFQWPLVSDQADPEATRMFESALATRAAWRDFPGFSGKLSGNVDGRELAGTVEVAADGSVKLALDEDVVGDWVQQQLESITMHRAASSSSAPRKAGPVIRFADHDENHPLGRLLSFSGGHFATSYRIKDGQIATVNRLLDGQNMTITVLDNEKNSDGFYLPRSYTVQYWDDATGSLRRSEAVQDRFERVENWDLPSQHTVTATSADGFSVRAFRIREHRIMKPASR